MLRHDQDFTAFVSTRSAALVWTARRACGDADLAEDLVQSALEKAYQHWPRIEPASQYSYVRRSVLNQHLTRLRRRPWREHPVGDSTDLDTRCPRSTPDPITRIDARTALDAALARLTCRERTTVVLRYLEDRSEAETAATLGVAVGTVKSTVFHALRKLRQSPHLAGLHP